MGSDTWNGSIVDEVDRISRTRVLSELCIRKIDRHMSSRVNIRVFQNRAKSNGIVNHWFRRGGQINDLGIASTFNVEDALVRPAMFVVTNQRP